MREKRSALASFDFRWTPGVGPDPAALKRLEERFPEPCNPMGEAWLMGEREIYWELRGCEPATMPLDHMPSYLREITSGTHSFGWHEDWSDWFHFFLPRLVPRALETHCGDRFFDLMVSGFIALHPVEVRGAAKESETLRRDVLTTLGRVTMQPCLWDLDEPSVEVMERLVSEDPDPYGNWNLSYGSFSAAMFLCWKYLQPSEVAPWLHSVLAIRSSYFRAQLLVWLLLAQRVITGSIATFDDLDKSHQQLGWENAYLLKRYWDDDKHRPMPLIVDANRVAFNESLQQLLTEELVLKWIDDFSRVPALEATLGRLPDRFIAEYFQSWSEPSKLPQP